MKKKNFPFFHVIEFSVKLIGIGLIDVSGTQCVWMLCVAQDVKDTHYDTLLREIKMQKRIPCPNVILILESRYAIIFHVNSLLNIS